MSRGSSPPVEGAETASWIRHLGRDVPGSLPTLATAEAGQCVRVTAFLSETVRHRCAELGIREGDLMVCRDQTPGAVTLELPEGHSIALERPGAALVQVERLGRRECVRPLVGARAGAGPRRRRSGATHPR